MKTILISAFILFSFGVKSQITFNLNLPFLETATGIEELPDGTFLASGDSVTTAGLVFKLNKCGQLIYTYMPFLRNENVKAYDVTADPYGNGYAICGYVVDNSGNDSTGFYLHIDSMQNKTDSIFYAGGINGPSAISIHRNKQNNFIVGTEAFQGGGNSSAEAQKINYPSTRSWTATGGSNLVDNGIALDSSDHLLMASFNYTAAFSAYLNLYDTSGNPIHNFSITDTAMGGSLIFSSVAAPAPDGNYMFGVNISPNAGNHGAI
jgi:hypothetical protein